MFDDSDVSTVVSYTGRPLMVELTSVRFVLVDDVMIDGEITVAVVSGEQSVPYSLISSRAISP